MADDDILDPIERVKKGKTCFAVADPSARICTHPQPSTFRIHPMIHHMINGKYIAKFFNNGLNISQLASVVEAAVVLKGSPNDETVAKDIDAAAKKS